MSGYEFVISELFFEKMRNNLNKMFGLILHTSEHKTFKHSTSPGIKEKLTTYKHLNKLCGGHGN